MFFLVLKILFYGIDQFLCYCIFLQEVDNDLIGEVAVNIQQIFIFYELDFGLNYVVRKYSEFLEEYGNFFIIGIFFLELFCIFLFGLFYVQFYEDLFNRIWKL